MPSGPAWFGFGLDRTRALLFAALVACATLPYLNILSNGFVYDDDTQVVQNPYIHSFRYLRAIFTTNVWSFRRVYSVSNYYRPMMTLGYLLCYKVFGLKAYGFHLASLLLHVLVVCLIFVLLEGLTGDRAGAFIAGALFALHPVHSESVAWIAGVTDLELTFFYLLTFGFFLALARQEVRRSGAFLAAMGISFLLALFSKEQAMTLPILATIYEHFYREDRLETTTSQKLARYGLLWVLSAAYMLLRIHFLGTLAPADFHAQVTLPQTVMSAIALVGQYVGKLIWPARLCMFYLFHPSVSLLDPRVLAGVLALIGLAALFLICWRSRERNVRLASFGVVWFLATLGLVLNPHWLGPSVFSERYLYLPSVGVAWLAGLGGSKLWLRAAARAGQRRALALAGLVVGVLFAARIAIRDRDWNNDIVLFSRTLDVSPDAYPILDSLGSVYWRAGVLDKAESLWQRALALDPEDVDALNNLGLVARQRREYSVAVDFFTRAIKFSPGVPDPHRNLGTTYRFMGMPGPAEEQLRAAVALSPNDDRALDELGALLLDEGRQSEAEDLFNNSVRSNPNIYAYDFLGEINLRRGLLTEAERDFRAALELDESDSNAHFGLGDIYRAVGRKSEALREYQAGLVKDPTNSQAQAALQKMRQEDAGIQPRTQ